MLKIIRNTLAILLFLTANAYAGGAMGLMMAAGSSAAASSCDPTTDEIGYRTTGGTASTARTANTLYCVAKTPDCVGSLDAAYIYGSGNGKKNKLYLYSKTTTAPAAEDVLLDYSGEMTFVTDASLKSALSTNNYVLSSAECWVCAVTDSDPIWYYDIGATVYYKAIANSYATPPETLSTGFATGDRNYTFFFSIGP